MEMVARRHILAGASVFFSCLVAAGFRQADLPGVEAASRQA